jgi:hypothetical protein
MFFLILFCFSAYYLLTIILSFNSIWVFDLNDWKRTEGVVFRTETVNEKKKIYEVRFVTEKLEWITAVPTAYSYNTLTGPFEGDKVSVYYNSKNPYEFSVNATWAIENPRLIKYCIIIFLFAALFYSMYGMLDSGFARELLELFEID